LVTGFCTFPEKFCHERAEDGIDHKGALVTEEKDLWVWMTSDMKPNKQCRSAADKHHGDNANDKV